MLMFVQCVQNFVYLRWQMTVTIIKHIDIEGPGTIGDFLKDDGISYDVIDVFNGEPLPGSLSGTSAVIVLGGPMNVYEEDKYSFLKQEDEFLKEVIEKEVTNFRFLSWCPINCKSQRGISKTKPSKGDRLV